MKKQGLTTAEAEASKQKYGSNAITEHESDGFWKKLRDNFGDPMIKILCVALVINIIFTFLGQTEWYESVGIAAAVILATFVSTFSEYRNENAFQKLQEEASRILCKVYRDGEVAEIPISDIVVGDCVILQSGDKIPADGIITDGTINVDQSALNGESKEAVKTAVPDDYREDAGEAMDFLNKYKVFRGSVVCSGNSVMQVTVVGDKSVYGQIAGELQAEDERDSPLKVKLAGLAGGISKFGYIGGIAVAAAFLFKNIIFDNRFDMTLITAYCSDWKTLAVALVHAVMLAVIIIVMAVPEGLPLMIALVSALNMGKMLRDNVLVRKIAGIETAGSLNILFSDKTGTITKGQLETVTFVSGGVEEYAKMEELPSGLKDMLALAIKKNTNAVITGTGKDMKAVGGNATERAAVIYAAETECSADVKVTASIPFNSTNKYSASTVQGEKNITLIKGAPEKIIQRCKFCCDNNGNKAEFTSGKQLEAKIDELAQRAIRVLAFAVSEKAIEGDALPDGDWTLIGVIGIRDEVRPESITAIQEVHGAGVQVVMITGDRKDTAVAIAKESGIIQSDDDIVMTSDELAKLSDEELRKKISGIKVVARALPTDKSRLVRIAQEVGLVVGMTGDGVNDSPALKKADVGFAMGGGTEVAKEAGDIVILDDNFNSIAKAVLYGRTIFNSIRKFIIFQLTINVSAVLVSFIMPLFDMENPLSIIQILWVNLVMDTLAALAFGGEPALKRYMKEKPKKREENIVSGYMWSAIITGALWITFLSMFILFRGDTLGWFRPGTADNPAMYLMTGYFAYYIFIAAFNAFNARTERINLMDNIEKNHGFWKVILLIAAVQVLMTYLGGDVLNCYGLNINEWLVVIAFAFTIIPVDIIRKAIWSCVSKVD